MPRDAVSRTANVGTVGKNGLNEGKISLHIRTDQDEVRLELVSLNMWCEREGQSNISPAAIRT